MSSAVNPKPADHCEDLLGILERVISSVNRLIHEKYSASSGSRNSLEFANDLQVRNLLLMLVAACRDDNLEQSTNLLEKLASLLKAMNADG